MKKERPQKKDKKPKDNKPHKKEKQQKDDGDEKHHGPTAEELFKVCDVDKDD